MADTATAAGTASGAAPGDETVLRVEGHCELKTPTKLFCGCRNAFGDTPNTNVCPVCLGLPGSLPVLNKQAVDSSMRIGLALHCEVKPSLFHRKNYFYPDMPKDYQVTQYDEPLNSDGWLELPWASGCASCGPIWRRTPASPPTWAGPGASATLPTPSLTTTEPGCRWWRSSANPTSARPRRRGPTWTSCGPSWWPPARPTGRWRKGRCASTPTSPCGP